MKLGILAFFIWVAFQCLGYFLEKIGIVSDGFDFAASGAIFALLLDYFERELK